MVPLAAFVQTPIDAVRAKLPVPGVDLMGANRPAVRGAEAADVAGGVRATVATAGKNSFDAEIYTPAFVADVKKGDVVFYSFRARALEGDRESGRGGLSAFLQRPRQPWDGFDNHTIGFGREWTTQYRAAVADKDYPTGELQLTMHIAGRAQTIEIADLVVLNLGANVDLAKLPVTRTEYAGRAPGAAWRKKADAMIRQHRTGPLAVRVVDERGRPVRNATVRIEQKSHAYRFGSFTETTAGETGPVADRFRQEFPKFFTHATVPIYWADWGWESPTARATFVRAIDWAQAKGLPMKAHCLLWPSERWTPTSLKGLKSDPPALERAIFTAMDARIVALKNRPFVNVDVLNELKTETEFADALGTGLYRKTFDRARAAWPKADLVYNEFATFENGGDDLGPQRIWEARVRELRRLKAPVTKLGWQAHFGEGVTPPEKVWSLLDRYRKEFGLPFEITEFDVDTRDESLQADYLRDLLTAWFAHPATTGFTVWGFYEGTMWKPGAAFFRKDWSLKPNGQVWLDLVRKGWWTTASTRSDAAGRATARAFFGRYKVVATANGRATTATVEHRAGGPVPTIVLRAR